MVRSVDTPAGRATGVRRGSRSLALAVLAAVLFLTFLDNTIVSVALGSVQTELHAGVSELQWVVSAYALTFAGAMLAFGMVGDEFGRKRVMLIGVGIFCGGSVLAALAPNIGVLIAARAVMGLGAAASEPGTLSMIRHIYTEQRSRAEAIGVWTAVSALALALGPVIGGALVGVWDWRGIFWFNLAFGLGALVAGALVLPESADPDAHRVDIAGTVLGAAALTAFVFAIIGGESAGFGSPSVILLLCLSALAAAAFFWRESRAAHPLLDLRFLRVPAFLTANIVAFCAYFATFAVFFFSALYLQEVAGFTGYRIALVFLPMTVLMIVSSLLAGRWTDPAVPRWSIFIGCLLFGAGLLLTAETLNPDPAYLPLASALALTGIGIGATVVPITSAALSAVPAARVRHGRVGHQHQPGDRRADRGGHPGRTGQRATAVQPDQPAAPSGHPGHVPGHRDQGGGDRRGAVQREHQGRRRRRSGRAGHAGAGGHPRRVQRVLRRAARRAAGGRDPRAGGRRRHVRAAQPRPAAACPEPAA